MIHSYTSKCTMPHQSLVDSLSRRLERPHGGATEGSMVARWALGAVGTRLATHSLSE